MTSGTRSGPSAPWPLGVPDACGSMDLLVTDAVEALRLSGAADLASAAREFHDRGVGALVITNGEQDMLAWSGGRFSLPLAWFLSGERTVRSILKNDPSRLADTTGCGDNFLGGLIASLAMQLDGGSSCAWNGSSSLELGAAPPWRRPCPGVRLLAGSRAFMPGACTVKPRQARSCRRSSLWPRRTVPGSGR
jgi:sugar/nucleoside kinase (ribokinase family)